MRKSYRGLKVLASIKAADRGMLALFLAGALFWSWVLWPYYTIPSQDDGLNHLAYVGFLKTQSTWTLGHVSYPFSDEFGSGNLVFYPVGMHALLAVMASLLGITELGPLLKTFAIVTLATLGPVTLGGIRRVAPGLAAEQAVLLAAGATTLLIFPSAPLGEGGLPRVLGQVIALPIAFAAWAGGMSPRSWFWSICLVTPLAFYIHPSSFFVLFPALLLVRPGIPPLRQLAALVTGATLSALPMLTGEIHPGQLGISGHGGSLPGFSDLYDRFKGVFHFLFSDPHGLLKFASLRSLLAYIGIGLLIGGHSRRRNLVLVLVPFALSLSVLLPWRFAQAPGAVFYQSVKRISEVGFLPLVACMAIGLEWTRARLGIGMRRVITLLLLVWAVTSGLRSQRTVGNMAEMFETPTREEAAALNRTLEAVAQGGLVVSHQQWFGVIRSIRPDIRYVGAEGECRFSSAPACTGRARFISAVREAAQSGGRIEPGPFGDEALNFIHRENDGFHLIAVGRKAR